MLAARLAAAGEAAWLAGLTERAVELLDRALQSRPDALLRAHIQELRGAVETRCGSLDRALSTLMEAAEAVEDTDPDTAIRLFADGIHVSFYLGEPAAAMRACTAIDRLLVSSVDPNARFLGSVASGMALVLNGAGASGIERVRSATYQLVVPDEVPADRFRLPLRLQGALWLRDSGQHRDVVVEAIDRMREQAALGSLPYLLMHIARDAATTDRWDDAESAYLEGIRLARETGQTTDLAASLAGLACLNARRGRVEDCRDNVSAAEELCRRNHIRMASFWLEFAQGDLAAGLGDAAGAVHHYEALQSALAATGFADPDQSCAPELVETYVHLGRLEDAARVAKEFASQAEAKAQPWSLARAERAFGLCTSGAQAQTHFRAALQLHEQTPDRFERARTELAFGARLRRERRRSEARPLLRSALETFELLGAAPWADRAAQELQATGETVHRREANAMDELTPQERQIAQLLAQGRTTREAAAALFLSPKTVEYHLRHVYLKLGVRSRASLAALFGG
jgi:DNA-binding CsgD family transcriptional regulator